MNQHRSARVVIVILMLLGGLAVAGQGSREAQAAGKRTCKTVKRHGKKVRRCSTPKPTPRPTSTPVPSFPVHPSDGLPAVHVSPHTDAGRAVTQKVSPGGGTISATGADGTVYLLTLAKDSLISNEAITLTPLTGVDGLPGGRHLVAGVQLDPEGLQLVKAATLTITPAGAVSLSGTLSFASLDTGADFHLYPQAFGQQSVTMQISHFTEYGVFPGSATDVEAQLHHGSASYISMTEQLQAALQAARQGQSGDVLTPERLISMITATANAWYEQKILPEMQAAAQPNATDDAVTAAIRDALAWDKSVQYLGVGDDPKFEAKWTTLRDLMQKAVAGAYARAVARCTDQHMPQEFGRILAVDRTIQLMGVDLGPEHDASGDVVKCLRFELDVDTTITRAYPIGTGFETSHVRVASLELQPTSDFAEKGTLSGAKNLESLAWSKTLPPGGCSYVFDGGQAKTPFQVKGLGIDFHFQQETGAAEGSPTIEMTMSPGDFRESATLQCTSSPSFASDWNTFGDGWFHLHRAETISPQGTPTGECQYVIKGWTYLGGEVWATKTYNQTASVNASGITTWTESTTMTLRHTPIH
jgi:hypothetical protein